MGDLFDNEDSPRANKPLLSPILDVDEDQDEEHMIVRSINHPSIEIIHSPSTLRLQYAPEDRFSLNYIVFYFLGMTSILPWNFILMAEDYWLHKFRNVSSNNSDILTPRQEELQADLSMSSAIPSTIFLILNVMYGHKIKLKYRMIGSYAMMTLLMSLTTLFVNVNTDTWQDEFFYITLGIVIAINAASSIACGGLFGIAGQFPSEYMTAVVSGQALGGIFAALAEIIIITFQATPETSAFFYFIIGTVALMASIVLYVVINHTFYFKYFINHQIGGGASSDRRELIAAPVNNVPHEAKFRTVFDKIWVYGFSEWLVFVTTLAIYPSVTVLVVSQNKGNGHLWNDMYFVPVVNFLLFNSGDYLGRILAGLFEAPKNKPMLVAFFTIARILFIPALALCNTRSRHSLPVLIHSDMVFIALMAGLALTNGYFTNICMIYAPKVVKEHEKELASSIMAASLGIGLACGSLISFALVEII